MPIGSNAVHLLVRSCRRQCLDCARVWSDDLSPIGWHGRKLTGSAVWWALSELVLDARSVLACARGLQCSWSLVNEVTLERARDELIDMRNRFEGVEVLGVDEHVWRHTVLGNRYVTVIVDLTPRGENKPARLLDMVEGRSEKVFSKWLSRQSELFRSRVRVVAMDAFAGYKKAASKQVPHAVEVLDPFHIVKLAGNKLDVVRRRLQVERTGKRGTKSDSLYRCRRVLLKTAVLRTDRQKQRVDRLLEDETNRDLKLAEGVYQKIIDCYRQNDRRKGKNMMKELIESMAVKGSAPNCPELLTLGRTLKRRMSDVLAFFDWSNSANGPTEAINGRLETLRGIALGFRNQENYKTRSLIHAGGFRQTIHNKT